MARLETVEINRNGQRVVINKRDFDAEKHELWSAPEKQEAPKAPAPASKGEPKKDLSEQYEELYGKKPHHKLKPENIKAAIDKKLED